MKRLLVLSLVLGLLVFSSLAWAGPVTINVIGMQQAAMTVDEMKQVAKEFEAKNPDIKVNLTFVGYDALHDKIATAMAGGAAAYDAVLVDDIWYAEFAEAGWLWDVTSKITKEMKEDIGPAGWEIVTYKNKVWGMPWLLDAEYFYYNEEMLKKAGFSAPPKTWQELEQQAKVMKAKGIVEYPIIWSWSQNECSVCDFVAILYGFGGKFFDENNNPVFNDAHGVNALSWMVKTLKDGISNPASTVSTEEEVRLTFSQGKAAYALNWLYMYDLANDPKESKVAGKVKMSLVPSGSRNVVSSTINGSMGYSVTATSKHKEEAWKFILYLTSKDVQKRYSAHMLPIWKSLAKDPELVKLQPVTLPMFAKQWPYAHVRPKVPYYPEASKILQVALQKAFTGKLSPKKALDEAAKKIKEIQY